MCDLKLQPVPRVPGARGVLRRAAAVVACLAAATPAFAHAGGVAPDSLWSTWGTDRAIVVPLILLGWMYAAGWIRLREALPHFPHRTRLALCFAAGWLALAVALVSPLHPLSEQLFSAHMTQHEILMVIAAPLLVLGRPGAIAFWVLPRRATRTVALAVHRSGLARLWSALTAPFAATVIHGLALWAWHVPRWYEATLGNPLVHTAQHACFLGTAVLFWEAVLRGRHGRVNHGASVLALFLTGFHSGGLGALLTFSTGLWYPIYTDTAPLWGLTPLQDQQLGGLIMWVPGGLAYIIAGLVLFGAWLQGAGRPATAHRREPSTV